MDYSIYILELCELMKERPVDLYLTTAMHKYLLRVNALLVFNIRRIAHGDLEQGTGYSKLSSTRSQRGSSRSCTANPSITDKRNHSMPVLEWNNGVVS